MATSIVNPWNTLAMDKIATAMDTVWWMKMATRERMRVVVALSGKLNIFVYLVCDSFRNYFSSSLRIVT